jgi:hypothetical protein
MMNLCKEYKIWIWFSWGQTIDLGPEPKLSILTIIFKVYFRNLEFFGLQIFNGKWNNACLIRI